MVHIPFLNFSFSYLRSSLLPQNYIYIPESRTFLNCQCNVFWPCVAIVIAIKKDCSYKNNCGIRLHDGDLEHRLMKEKNRSSYVFLPIFTLFHSRFRFRNLKDTTLFMISWCITISSLLICSWHEMTLSQFVQ